MKQLIKSFILVLTTLVTLTACGSDEPQPEPAPSPTPDPGKVIDATAISFAITEEVLSPGETYQLKPTTTPENATISYTSSNTDVATVDDKGVVTAKQVGETEIMATSGKERARFNLYVQNDDKINLEIVENLGGKATIKVTPLVDKPYFIWLMPKGQLEDPINGGLKWVWLKFDRAFWIWCQDNTGTPWQEFAKTFSNRGEMTYITDDESLGSNRISLLQWMLD